MPTKNKFTIDYQKEESKPYLSFTIVLEVFKFIIVYFSVFTLILLLSNFFEIQFYHFVYTVCIAFVGILIYFFSQWKKFKYKEIIKDYSTCILLIVIICFSVFWALAINAPEEDDVAYVQPVRYFIEYPFTKLNTEINPLIGNEQGVKYSSILKGIAFSYEMFWGVLSFLTHTEYLFYYHIIGCSLAGTLLILSYFLLFEKFSKNLLLNLLGVFAVSFSYLYLRELLFGFASMAYVKIWEGKAQLLVIFLPVYLKFSLDYFEKNSRMNWLYLLQLSLVGIGLSTSSLIVIPLFAFSLGLAYIFHTGINLNSIKKIVVYGFSLFIICIVVLVIYSYSIQNIALNKDFEVGPAIQFSYKIFFASPFSYTSILFYLCLGFVLLNFKKNKFMILWMSICLALYFNPLLLESFLFKYIIPPIVYPRIYFFIPLPFIIGLALINFSNMTFLLRNRLNSLQLGSAFLIGLLSYFVILFPFHNIYSDVIKDTIYTGREARIIWPPTYKLSDENHKEAIEIISLTKNGKFFGPSKYNMMLSILTSKYEFLYSWLPENVRIYSVSNNSTADAEQRLNAFNFLQKSELSNKEDFITIIKRYSIDYIVIDILRNPEPGVVEGILLQSGYTILHKTDKYYLYQKL